MKKVLFVFGFLGISWAINAQKIDRTLIQNAVREGVDAVVLFDDTEFIIENQGSSVTKKHWAIMVFNQAAAEEHGVFQAYYDKFSKIRKIEGNLYDLTGKVVETLKTRDQNDVSLSAYGDDISDSKVKLASFDGKNYTFPYVVEFSFEKQNTNMLFYPGWSPLVYEKTWVESSTFTIRSNGVPFKVKERSTNLAGIIRNVSDPYFKQWKLTKASVEKHESFSRNLQLPLVLASPELYSIDSYGGTFKTWKDVGQFYHDLNKYRGELPAEEISAIKSLMKPTMTEREKVEAIYKYMQSKTRYMSIQLGIGGWQSIPAQNVSKTGYGDCKALTNYTVALLKAVGVAGYPALIDAGDDAREIDPAFPSLTFNHVIACVPLQKDTLWLECTSQTNPMGYQGDFTGNRKALLVKDKESRLVNTTQYSPEQNFQHRTAEVWLQANGEAKIEISSSYGGIQQDYRAHVSSNFDAEEQRKFMMNSIQIPGFELEDFRLEVIRKELPEVKETASVYSRKLASVSGKRLFLQPNLLSTFFKTPFEEQTRTTDLYLNPNRYSFQDKDSVVYHLPDGFKTESVKEQITFESEFGDYRAQMKRDGNTLIYTRSVEMKGGDYPKEEYSNLINFIKEINKADRQRVVFLSEGT